MSNQNADNVEQSPPEGGDPALDDENMGPPGSLGPVALDLRDHVLFDPDTPTQQPITAGEHIRLDLVCLEPKQTLPAVTLAGDRLYTVVGGRAWAVIEDAEVVLEPLQAVLVPAGAAHGVRNDSADPLILHVVSAPPETSAIIAPAEHTHADVSAPPTSRQDRGETPGSERFAGIRRILGSRD